MKNEKITLESTLKSIETENWLDRKFYRPIGFQMTLLIKNTGITPNMVTIFSIIVGICGGFCFYFPSLKMNIIAVGLMIFANILDCVDGQLARLNGIKSKIGRILDGFAGDLWFSTLYFAIALRLINIGFSPLVLVIAVISGYSHARQAAMADYYKTFHLFLISRKKGEEFDNYENLRILYLETKWKDDWIYKFFLFFYRFYTIGQERITPKLQNLIKIIDTKYLGDIPDNIRVEFRQKSRNLMPLLDWLTFNGRTPVLFILSIAGALLINTKWAVIPLGYYLFEIFILNLVLFMSVRKHEKICTEISQKL
ncbi:MAG: CDP-alcohol phosphatidyltransferase family protein [Saprospiraceae bacterium]|nr:CDP-alcohol phosphatidyltransferase family protein [Saprospiraceae bacterium]